MLPQYFCVSNMMKINQKCLEKKAYRIILDLNAINGCILQSESIRHAVTGQKMACHYAQRNDQERSNEILLNKVQRVYFRKHVTGPFLTENVLHCGSVCEVDVPILCITDKL